MLMTGDVNTLNSCTVSFKNFNNKTKSMEYEYYSYQNIISLLEICICHIYMYTELLLIGTINYDHV